MLVTYWNGQLEHDRKAPGLSTYTAGSQLLVAIEAEADDPNDPQPKRVGQRGEDRGPRRPRTQNYRLDGLIARLLRKGVSYGAITRQLGVSYSPVRRVAKGAAGR